MDSTIYTSSPRTAPFLNSIRDAINAFDAVYGELAELGFCDALGGMEYKRKRGEWITAGAKVRRITEFAAG